MTIDMVPNIGAVRGSPYILASFCAASSRKRLNPPGSQNFPALESAASKLWRYEDRIGSRRRDLCGQALPIAHVARQVGAVAVKENHHDGRTIGIKSRRDVQQHPVVAVGFRFPIYAAAEIDMAAVAFFTCIEERMIRSGHGAMIGERRGLEINETRLCRSARGKAANDDIWHAMKRRNLWRNAFQRCDADRRHDLRRFCRCRISTGLRYRLEEAPLASDDAGGALGVGIRAYARHCLRAVRARI